MTNATRPLYRRDVAPHGVGIVCIDEARVTSKEQCDEKKDEALILPWGDVLSDFTTV